MPNDKNENLIPNSERTADELRDITKKGGKKSGEARRKKRDIKNAYEIIAKLPVSVIGSAGGHVNKILKENGNENVDLDTARAFAVFKKALEGDVRANQYIDDVIGDSPAYKFKKEELALKRKQIESPLKLELSKSVSDTAAEIEEYINSIKDE